MKKLITILTAGSFALCSGVFATGVHPNDVINTVPGSSNRTILANSSSETHSSSDMNMTASPSKTTTAIHHHHKKHNPKLHHHKHKHHHHKHKPHHHKVVTKTTSH